MQSAIAKYIKTLIRESVQSPRKILSKVMQFITRPLFSMFTVYPLASKNRMIRECVFNAAHASKKIDLFCIQNATENLIISCKDSVISRGLFSEGEFDFNKFVVANELLKRHQIIKDKIDLLVDVGANIGSICIPSIMRGYVKRAMAIEPDPRNCRILRANVALNALDVAIDVHEVAVGATDNQRLELELSERNWGDHRISVSDADERRGESARERISIKSTTLDSLIDPLDGEIILMWMDTQGYEGHVLKGARQSIVKSRIPMVVEFWPYGMIRTGGYELLKASISEYSGFYDLESPNGLQPFSKLDELFAKLHAKESFTDLLVI
jgi:FkbM family methyltransferase